MSFNPPGSFWLLANSSNFANLTLLDGNDSLALQLGVWHCLPNRWRAAAEACRQRSAIDYSMQVQLWENPQ